MSYEKSVYQGHIGQKLPEKCDFQHFTLFLASVPNVDIWIYFWVKRNWYNFLSSIILAYEFLEKKMDVRVVLD